MALEGTSCWGKYSRKIKYFIISNIAATTAINNGLGAHTDTLTPYQASVQLKVCRLFHYSKLSLCQNAAYKIVAAIVVGYNLDIGHSALQARRSLAVHPDLHDTEFQARRLCRDGRNGLLRPNFHSDFLHSLRALVCLLGSGSSRADDEMSTYLKTGIRFRCD